MKITGRALEKVDRGSDLYRQLLSFHPRLAQKDPTLWGRAAEAEASIRLNWVDLPESSQELLPIIERAKESFQHCSHLILCGMGGSSLGPEVIAATYKRSIFIMDSTDPDYISHSLDSDLSRTLIIIGSKSGSTLETSAQRALFQELLAARGLDPTRHMLIVTDPGSPLDQSSRAEGFSVINADPHVGGRFSVLSAFGLVPSAFCGVDVGGILRDASLEKTHLLNDPSPVIDCVYLLLTQSRQYLGFTDSGSGLPGLSDWIEQLIAESTGKDGTGRLPVVTESVESACAAGFGITFAEGGDLNLVAPLGAHFIFWEWATALLGAALEIDPFNQPNVTEAKEQTASLLRQWGADAPQERPHTSDGALEYFGDELDRIVASVKPDGYIAIMAYLDRRGQSQLLELRRILEDKCGRPVTFGWGPRFLHSTGQFHKAGQPNGTFIQISGEPSVDLDVPGQIYSFETLLAAQCQGDGRALQARGYPVTRIHLRNRSAGVTELLEKAAKL